MARNLYLIAADLVLALHTLFVIFVVLGLVLILSGKAMSWSWVRNPWFRLCHLLAIALVLVQSWLDILCPLTTLEMLLREAGGGTAYAGSFIGHWLQTLLYYQAPLWVFTLCYTLFGASVLAAWFWVPPRPFRQRPKPRRKDTPA